MEKLRALAPRLSQLLFYAGAATGVFALIRTWLLNRNLPEGVCPIDTNRPLLYVALGMLAASLLLDVVFPRPKATQSTKGEPETQNSETQDPEQPHK
jgi:hypothetical protein